MKPNSFKRIDKWQVQDANNNRVNSNSLRIVYSQEILNDKTNETPKSSRSAQLFPSLFGRESTQQLSFSSEIFLDYQRFE